jgi:hypothetical protein
MLPVERTADGIAIISLTPNPTKLRGGVVVLDSWLIEEIATTLDAVAATSPNGIVLRSASERVFVAGADLAEIDALDDIALDAYLRRGSDAFASLFHGELDCPSADLEFVLVGEARRCCLRELIPQLQSHKLQQDRQIP